MANEVVFDPRLTKPDRLVLANLAGGLFQAKHAGNGHAAHGQANETSAEARDAKVLDALDALNDPSRDEFEPTIFTTIDYHEISWNKVNTLVLRPYMRLAQSVVRHKADVVMFTHLLLYAATTIPSALSLFFWRFTWTHGLLHFVMQVSYMGSYTLMMHQHIHQRGILQKSLPWSLVDAVFPYITDPLMGHTWNSYFYHHVKHHHIEGNGPNDLSATIRYQRDDLLHFLHYVGRFFFLVWLDLPLYFVRTGKYLMAAKCAFWELGDYLALYTLYSLHPRATLCVYLLPLLLLRLGLMVGNWGQHAFVDDDEPDSDYRSSVTLIDVPSNRHSFNDGYHTSHHLNPLRHWRDHPNSFMKSKDIYAAQGALVFHNIDYIFITIKLMQKDYEHLAKCMVPIGAEQMAMSLEERAEHLRKRTRRFTEEEIKAKFKTAS